MANPGQKAVLITGCSSGIGLRMAVMLAKDEKQRYHVIATMRDLKRKDKLVEAAGDAYGKSLSLAVLDVCTDESVKQCIDGIKDRHVDVLSVVFNDVYAASKFAMEGFCECLAVQLLKFNVTMSMIEPGPVHTEFESKMIQDVRQKEFPGADADTVNYFKNVYLPSSVDIFETLGQTPDDIARCTKKVIEQGSSARFRNLTNPLYTPIVALKYADETGGLSVHAFYHMLFNLGPLMHVSMKAMQYLTCGCLRSRTISPN
ncbi:retinol dehydrogenase 8-like isoform X2 [Oncorhynchus mykiss]|uniref:retinol dehydrogenase 8-like isoform X2 n=1 Tax=Oncorhynchus mykiss TaxID=8022 RepID=UPI0018784E67|nr:retinol dehydrogenase 8-like isoform X2 [Oncorhynchus mykiss]